MSSKKKSTGERPMDTGSRQINSHPSPDASASSGTAASNLAAMYQSARSLQIQGDLDGAIGLYKSILCLNQNSIESLCNLGGALHQKGDFHQAIEYYRKALAINPDLPQIYLNLGGAQQALGQHDSARKAYFRAISIKADYLEAHFRLGMLDIEQYRYSDALGRFNHILSYAPNNPDIHNCAGICLKNLGDPFQAARHFERAALLQPQNFQALANLAAVLLTLAKWDESIEISNRALAINPSEARLHFNLGIAYKQNKRFDSAATCFRNALAIDASAAYAHLELTHTLQSVCDWREDAHSIQSAPKLIEKLLDSDASVEIDPFNALSWPLDPNELLRISERKVRQLAHKTAEFRQPLCRADYLNPKRVRVAYLSPKFRNHPGAHLMGGLFMAHNRDKFEISAYSIGPDDGSIYRRRIEAEAEHFIDLYAAPLQECIERIRSDRIHILVDLAGYTTGARPEIFAARSAPIQVNYLGFAGTLGADFFDYLITDAKITPPNYQAYFAEKFAYLSHCYQINDDRDMAAESFPSKSECHLPEGAFVFCCFNNNYKIDPEIFRAWSIILAQVPGSVLWLLKGSELQMNNLRREADRHGVAPERVIFAEPVDKATHLSRHAHADLFLDTLYYNAHTTGSDALRQGVPMITCQGNTFASRVGSSLLHAVGLDELVTTDLDQYITKAVRLATDPEHMNTVRNRLRSNLPTTSLLDNPRFARSLERLYEVMWDRFAQSEAPRQIGPDDTA